MAIAAVAEWHGAHDAALALIGGAADIPAHALLETYSVLTRLPHPHRVAPEVAREVIALRFPEPPLTLPEKTMGTLVERLAAAGVSGGACYDGLVGLTAAAAGATLVSLDRRAARTYERLGVDYRLA